VSDQSHRSVSAISYEKNRTCSVSDNVCRTIKSCTTFNVTHTIKIVRTIFIARLTSALGGAEIARPDKTAPDQTARLNNGGHDYMTVL